MKKFIISTLILMFAVSIFFSYEYFSRRKTSLTAKNNAVKSSIKKNYEPANESGVTLGTSSDKKESLYTKNKINNIYNILGDSPCLTAKEKSAMSAWRNDAVNLARQNKEALFINGNPSTKTICLTFDDGPDNIIMPKILTLLKSENVNASFFLIGKNIYGCKAVIKRAYEDGNLILSHSYNHNEMTKMSDKEIDYELNMSQNAIFNVIGRKPLILRPPYGSVTQRELSLISSRGYKAVLWSIDTLDWSKKDKIYISNNVLNNVRPGDIVLMHCNSDKEASYEALSIIIKTLKQRGYSFLTLDKMLNIKAYE